MDEKIKRAFSRAKKDVFSLGNEVQELRTEVTELKSQLKKITQFIDELRLKEIKKQEKSQELSVNKNTTHNEKNTTDTTHNTTHDRYTTHNYPLEGLRGQNFNVSTGNQGVPTDRQTDRQTDIRHIRKRYNNCYNIANSGLKEGSNAQISNKPKSDNKNSEKLDKIDHMDKAKEILENLDNLKKELRLKIKRLTDQEMTVFSLIYNLEEEGEMVDYSILASKMGLSEGSIRDYIYKMNKKGIRIEKEKQNNKRILLHMPSNLKDMASLDTILKLRDL